MLHQTNQNIDGQLQKIVQCLGALFLKEFSVAIACFLWIYILGFWLEFVLFVKSCGTTYV